MLGRLRGCLNVAALEDVYEDDTHVHMVLELCRGGELHHFIGETHYSGGCLLGAGAAGRWLVLAVGAGWAG